MHELGNWVGNTCCPCGMGQVPNRREKGRRRRKSADFPEGRGFLTPVLGDQRILSPWDSGLNTNDSPWALGPLAFLVLRFHIPPDFP